MIGATLKGNWVSPLVPPLKAVAMSLFSRQMLAPVLAKPSKEDLITMQGLLEARNVIPVIDRTYPLSEVPEAIRYLEEDTLEEK